MKSRLNWFFLVVLITSMILAGCKSSSRDADEGNYPVPNQEILPTETPKPTVPSGQALYPDLADQSDVLWPMAEGMILHGDIDSILLLAELKVQLNLKDGRVLFSIQPTKDSVAEVITSCGDACKDIEVTQE
jgi:hypothetical protein